MFDAQDRQDEKEIRGLATRNILWFAGVVFLIGTVATTVNYAITPLWGDLETKGLQHSYTYVSTKQELLVKLVQDYRKLETQQALNKENPDVVAALEGQKKATVDRIRSEATSLPKHDVPVEVAPFLN